MSAYFLFTYDISDPKGYEKYVPGSIETIFGTVAKHGGELLSADYESVVIDGKTPNVAVVIKFPSVDAAKAWHDDPDYAEAKQFRLDSTTNISAIIAKQFVPPNS